MKHGAIVFDLDGTLLDSLEDLADSMNAVLSRLGHPQHPKTAYCYFVGDGMASLARRALPEGGRDADTVAACVEAMRSEYDRRWAAKTRPYPGVPDLLDGLTRAGVPMAVFSNKPDDFTVLMVRELLAPWSFASVKGLQPGVPPKPDPTGALAVAAQMGVAPDTCLFLGDSSPDMMAARAAGMLAVGALWGFRGRQELVASGAQVLVEEPLQVLDLL